MITSRLIASCLATASVFITLHAEDKVIIDETGINFHAPVHFRGHAGAMLASLRPEIVTVGRANGGSIGGRTVNGDYVQYIWRCPVGVNAITIEAAGGGGGGGGGDGSSGGDTQGHGTNGGDTAFNDVIIGGGGKSGLYGSYASSDHSTRLGQGGAGGIAAGTTAIHGAAGATATAASDGGSGGESPQYGCGLLYASSPGANKGSAASGYGAGGAGGSGGHDEGLGGGGGGGGYGRMTFEVVPGQDYTIRIGRGGAGGAEGNGDCSPGGTGANGYMIIWY